MPILIHVTCSTCQAPEDVPASRLVLALPGRADAAARSPILFHLCPRCEGGSATSVTWRAASYLLDVGATTVCEPDDAEVRPPYPEQRPACDTPMTLDDLIDLHAALSRDALTA